MFKLIINGDLGFEVWQDIPGYEGLYQVSTYGRVKSLYTNKILKPSIANHYKQVTLCCNKIPTNYHIHRLVSFTFLPKPKAGQTQVNHKDENKLNNRVENLEWCDSLYNINYGTGIRRSAEQKHKPVGQYDINGNLVRIYQSAKEVSILNGFQRSSICCCCKGKRKTAYGFMWRYA